MKVIWLLIVLLCGSLLPLQAGLNARLSKAVTSPGYSSLVCFFIGTAAMALYLGIQREPFNLSGLRSLSWLTFMGGGIIGALFITLTMMAVPRLGMALTFGLIVTGQTIVAVLLDHFCILVSQAHPFNLWRLLGIILVIGGVVIVQRF